jgi:hypothetical protein
MSAAAPATTYPVLWADTQAGRAERWTREKMQQRYDFQGAIEFQGLENAARMMREIEDDGQLCHNHAPCAR